MGKRTAPTDASQKGSAKVAKVEKPIQKLLNLLKKEGEISQDCRGMISSALPHALGSSTERHAYQKQILGFVESILNKGQAEREAAVAACEKEQSEFEAKKSTSMSELESAKETAAAGAAAKESKAKACTDAETALAAEKSTLEEKEKAVQSLETEKKVALEEKQTHEATMADVWGPLKAFEFKHWRERNKKIAEFVKHLEKCGIPESLGAGLQAALKVKPDARGTFAAKTVEFAEEAAANNLKKLQEKLDAFDGEAAARGAAVEDARKRVAEATASLAAAQEDSMNAENAWAEMESCVVMLNTKIGKFDLETESLQASLEASKEDLSSFSEIKDIYVRLRDGQPAQEEEPPAQEVAAEA